MMPLSHQENFSLFLHRERQGIIRNTPTCPVVMTIYVVGLIFPVLQVMYVTEYVRM